MRGWAEGSGVEWPDALRRLADAGAEAVVVTQIEVEGLMGGADTDGLAEVLAATDLDVIASGGVGTLDDLLALDAVAAGGRRLAGAIVGTAIYEGRVDVAEAVGALRGVGMKTARIIPCLDVDDGRVVKGVNFVDLVDAGDPVELAARYDAEGADELVFLDITASSDARDTTVEMAARVAEQVFIPFTIGGGIRSVEDARRLLRAGADKVSVNSAAVDRPELIREIAEEFGTQCCVVAIDARRTDLGFEVFVHGGRIADRDRRPRLGQAGRGARGRGDPAHVDGSRRHQAGLRHRPHARHDRLALDPGDRIRRRGHARSTSSTACSRAAPMRCSRRRSSTSRSTPSPRPKPRCPTPGSPCDRAEDGDLASVRVRCPCDRRLRAGVRHPHVDAPEAHQPEVPPRRLGWCRRLISIRSRARRWCDR